MGRGVLIPVEDLLTALKRAKKPLTCAVIAQECGHGDLEHETARRRVRETIAIARGMGHRICADTIHGVWLESRDGEFAAYLGRRSKRAVGELAGTSRARRRSQSGPTLFDLGEPAHGADAFMGG